MIFVAEFVLITFFGGDFFIKPTLRQKCIFNTPHVGAAAKNLSIISFLCNPSIQTLPAISRQVRHQSHMSQSPFSLSIMALHESKDALGG